MPSKLISPQSREGNVITSALRTRAFELAMLDEFSKGSVRGTVHTCYGQELTPSLVMGHIRDTDVVFGTHRAHGYYLARTEDFQGLAAEILGKEGATSHGVGGSQHLAAPGFFANGIQGGTVPLAAGTFLGTQFPEDGVSVAVIGDGTLGEGVVYETLNIASLQQLPLLLLVENNGIAQSTPQSQFLSGTIEGRAHAFGVKYFECDSRDFQQTEAVISEVFAFIRAEHKPAVLNVISYRLGSHSKGDDNRAQSQVEELKQLDFLNVLVADDPIWAQVWATIQVEMQEIVSQVVLRDSASEAILDYSAEVIAQQVYATASQPVTSQKTPTGREVSQNRVDTCLASLADALVIGEDIETMPLSMAKPYTGAFGVTHTLSDLYPRRVINMPISEGAIIGLGIGRALAGMPTIVEIMFGDFTTLVVDQIRQQASKIVAMYGVRKNLPLLLRTPMGGRRGYGPTHSQNLESMFFGITNTIVFVQNEWNTSPDTYLRLLSLELPTIIVESKDLYPIALTGSAPVGYSLSRGIDVDLEAITMAPLFGKPSLTIVTYGFAATLVRDALSILATTAEIAVDVVVLQVVSPLDVNEIWESAQQTKKILLVEEGFPSQGLSSSIVGALSSAGVDGVSLSAVGQKREIGASKFAEDEALLSVASIISAVENLLGKS